MATVPTNLTAVSPAELIVQALLDGPADPIEAMTERGQQELIQSSVLPTKMSVETRNLLESWGVTFHDMVKTDTLFTNATLPSGWTIGPLPNDTHPLFTALFDENSRQRAFIRYDPKPYGRFADVRTCHRFAYTWHYLGDTDLAPVYYIVTDGGHRIWASEFAAAVDPSLSVDEKVRQNRARKNRLASQAKTWLNDRYPDWRDLTAYWA